MVLCFLGCRQKKERVFYSEQLQTSCRWLSSLGSPLLIPIAAMLMLLSLVVTFLLVPTAELTTRTALLKCWWKH